MDILRLSATFGRLEQRELTLSPGLNVLYAPNESGKSTWGAFIRTMLYGLSTRERGPLADKNRYAPWSLSPMRGTLALTCQTAPSGRWPLRAGIATKCESGHYPQQNTGRFQSSCRKSHRRRHTDGTSRGR